MIMVGSMLVAGGLLVCAAYLNTSSEVKLPGAAADARTAATSAAALGLSLPAPAPAVGAAVRTAATSAAALGLSLPAPTPAVGAAAPAAQLAAAAPAVERAAAPAIDPIVAFEADLDTRAQLEAGLSCHGRRGYDISGDAAFVWGLTWPVKDEVECCRACAAHRIKCAHPDSRGTVFWRASVRGQDAKCGKPGGKLCNAFVFCPAGRCFSYTPHNHSLHECWLKHESNITHPIAHGPDFPPEMRAAPRKHWPWAVSNVTWPGPVPESVQWIAGLVEPKAEPVWVEPRMPSWFTKFCTGRFGPCTRATTMPPPRQQSQLAATARHTL